MISGNWSHLNNFLQPTELHHIAKDHSANASPNPASANPPKNSPGSDSELAALPVLCAIPLELEADAPEEELAEDFSLAELAAALVCFGG